MLIMLMAEAYSQEFPGLQFDHITAKDGLSSNLVTVIAEDKQGFIWVGTSNGLNRYDGYRFKHFFHSDTDSNSLVNNSVQTILCDSRGRLWIGTESGVSCYLPGQNTFINYDTKLKPPFYINNNSSVRIYEDETGTVWLCNERDLIYKVKEDMTLAELKINIPPFYITNLPLLGYDKIFRDHSGHEWAFRANRIYSIDKQTRQPLRTFIFPELQNVFIQKVMQDSEGNYWVATWGGGVFRFFPGKDQLLPVSSIPKGIYQDLTEWTYKEHTYLAAVEADRGLYLIDRLKLTAAGFSYINGDPSSLQGANLNSIFIDSRGSLWLSSSAGINVVKAGQSLFDIIPVTDRGSTNFTPDRNGPVYSYFETDSSIWLSKRYKSTFEYDKNFRLRNFYKSLYPLTGDKQQRNGFAYSFYRSGNELFISTDSGLVLYDLKSRSSKEYFPEGQFPFGLGFRTILPFRGDEIIIRTSQYGLFIFNTVSKKFIKRYSNEDGCDGCLPLRLTYLFKTSSGAFFVTSAGAEDNLYAYNPQKDRFEKSAAARDAKYPMQGNDLFGMDEDSEGHLWIAGTSGVFIYDTSARKIINKLPSSNERGSTFRICLDKQDNAWINGNSGVWCYIKATGRWIQFNNQDGLPGSSFDGVIARTGNNDIAAGLEGALAIFHIGKLFSQNNEPPAIITEAAVGKNEFSYAGSAEEKKLVVNPGENSFSVDFAVLNYLHPASTRYYYKLSPLMKEFQLNDNGHINFNGLAPGHYTLHVKGGDKTGNIFQSEDILDITVEPKWYQAKWFFIASILLAGLLIYYFVRRRITRIRTEAALKQKITETRMQALRAQMNPHFIFNSLNSIENFIMQNEKRQASDYLNKFSKLIRSILESSRNELVPVSKDMEALQWYVDLEELRFNNRFAYKVEVDPALLSGDYRIPSLLIQPYVENAILHGLAHSEKEGLLLSVRVLLENEKIRYVITDNGIGREAAAKLNSMNKPAHNSVGLQITAERIKQLNGHEEPGIIFTDLYDSNNQPCGTKVEVLVKPS